MYLKYQETQHSSLWAGQRIKQNSFLPITQGRIPSAILDFDPDSLEVFRDFFDFEDYQKYLTYDVDLMVESDKSEEQKNLVENSLKEAINKTLIDTQKSHPAEGMESFDRGLEVLIKGNFFNQLVTNFKITLKEENISSGVFQINLNFSPRTTSEFTYSEELSSNNLTSWKQKGTLLKRLQKKNLEFHEHILHSPVPAGADIYQYKGGQISLWFEIPKDENTPKGFLRIRRYYRATELANSKSNIRDNQFRVNLVHFKSLEKTNQVGSFENFVTVDLYKDFNGTKEGLSLDRVELHFGKVLPSTFHKKNLSRGLASFNRNVIETSELNIHGALSFHNKEYLYITQVEKLVFDFKTGEFSNKSKLKTIFKHSDLRGSDLGSAQHKVSQKLLNEYGIELIKSFKLGEIHSKFGGKK